MVSKLNIKPLFDNILVKPLKAEEKSAGGIYLPQNAQEKPQIGEIMALGDGIYDSQGNAIPMDKSLKVGVKVMYTKWGGNDVKVNGEEWKLVKQTDILAIVL
jgi:chaperonin GroES